MDDLAIIEGDATGQNLGVGLESNLKQGLWLAVAVPEDLAGGDEADAVRGTEGPPRDLLPEHGQRPTLQVHLHHPRPRTGHPQPRDRGGRRRRPLRLRRRGLVEGHGVGRRHTGVSDSADKKRRAICLTTKTSDQRRR